jgi:hypothetical protein
MVFAPGRPRSGTSRHCKRFAASLTAPLTVGLRDWQRAQ